MSDDVGGIDIERLRKAAALLPVKQQLEKYRAIDRIILHPKQKAFADLMMTCSEVALFGGNRTGKSTTGAYLVVMHAIQDYPPDWDGFRYCGPINIWVIGPTAQHCCDVLQAKLVGPNIADPTGIIPLDAYDNRAGQRAITRSHGLPDAVDQIRLKCKNGGTSIITFKSHEQGREKLQGAGLHLIWSDEDCPLSIWTELVARTIESPQGRLLATFTPIKGMLPVAERFLQERSPKRNYVILELKDALHIPAERHQEIIDAIPAHERDARVYGIPSAGAGKVFQTSEEQIAEDMPQIPAYWPALWGTDFGHTEKHPFAAVLGVWDRDNDIIHIIHAVRVRGGIPRDHAAAIRSAMNGQAADVPVAWPHDGNVTTKESNKTVRELYVKESLRMLDKHATFPKGGFDTEAGVAEMAARFRDGRLRVARHLQEWFQEYRMYHRKEDGRINKIGDDLMSATRVLIMDIRRAKEFDNHRPGFVHGEIYRRPQQQRYAIGSTNNQPFDLFTGRPFAGGATHDRKGRAVGKRDYDLFNP